MMQRILVSAIAFLYASLIFTACGTVKAPDDAAQAGRTEAPSVSDSAGTAPEMEQAVSIEKSEETEQTAMKMNVQVGTYAFTATLEDNDAVRELTEMMQEGPVTIRMSDYSGFEKVGPLGKSLTTSNRQTTATVGDIVLYNGNSIVMFYGSNSWSYTRIGKIDDLTDWAAALGSGDITAVFTLAE